MPSATWLSILAKLTIDPLMPNQHVIHQVVVMRGTLIVHRPACTHKLQSTFLDQLPHIILLLVSLFVPPHREELHLNLGVPFLFICHQLHHNRVDNVLNIGHLDILFRASEVLVRCLQPADIVVTVRHDVHVQMLVPLTVESLKLIHLFLGVSLG